MFPDRIVSAEGALVYMTECTLATVSWLQLKSKPPKAELRRQINIAQFGIDWIRQCNIPVKDSPRVERIMKDGLTVQGWADRRE